MENLLLHPREDVEYAIQETSLGVWRRFLFPDGQMFAEFRSHESIFGMPWVHITWGRSPETMRRVTAKGVIAIGKCAIGGLALGHMSVGVIAIGQLGLGCFLGIGQATTGVVALGQLAIGGLIGIGQFTCGHMAIGQLAFGEFVLAQVGMGTHVWDTRGVDKDAFQFFRQLLFK
ncbi:MAG: hypothetical protein JWM11_747 [Planctomycetaceae bacterium]|nr:hypothetical protein [Planctomycetaceae bacterium]